MPKKKAGGRPTPQSLAGKLGAVPRPVRAAKPPPPRVSRPAAPDVRKPARSAPPKNLSANLTGLPRGSVARSLGALPIPALGRKPQ